MAQSVADEVVQLKAVLDARNAGQVEAEKQIDELQAELVRAWKEAARWAGEFQETRPELLEWRKLADMKERTPEQYERLRQINTMFNIESEEAPELRKCVEELYRQVADLTGEERQQWEFNPDTITSPHALAVKSINTDLLKHGAKAERQRIVTQVEGLIEKARNGRGSWEWVGTTTTAYRAVLALIQEEPAL